MHVDITIPTCKQPDEVAALVAEIEATATGDGQIIATCQPVCAAANRNYALSRATAPLVIMVDDDISKLPKGWDDALAAVLVEHPRGVMVSARLLNTDGKPGQMLGSPPDRKGEVVLATRSELPTACICVRNDGLRFDEDYIGSGWEDTDFCKRLCSLYYEQPEFYVHNGVRVTHANEQKEQREHFRTNYARYVSLWGPHPFFSKGQ